MVEKRPIDKLTIKGFKSLQNVELELGKLNVLIGPNGGGKSNLVSYFDMLRRMVEEDLQVWIGQQDGADRILTYGSKTTPQLDSFILFGENAYLFSLSHTVADRFVFNNEQVMTPSGGLEHSWGHGHVESKLRKELRAPLFAPRMAGACYASISDWKVYHFHDTGGDARLKKTHGLHNNLALKPDAANLAAYLYKVQHTEPKVYREIVEIIQLALPFFRDFVLEPEVNAKGNFNIRLMWRSNYDDDPFLADQLSDGSIRFICLVTALMQPDPPATIIIDEPEIGLHPYAITLLGALMHAASERMQVIAATQSVSLIDQFSVDNLIVVELENGVSAFRRKSEDDFALWLEDYSVGELWEKNVLGGRLP